MFDHLFSQGAGPTISGQSVNLWQYFSSRPTRQAEALLLQLFFDHSLRLRLHETATDKDEKDADMRKKKASIVGRISSLMVRISNLIRDDEWSSP